MANTSGFLHQACFDPGTNRVWVGRTTHWATGALLRRSTDPKYRILLPHTIRSPEDNAKGVRATHEGCSRSCIGSFAYSRCHTGENAPRHWTTQQLHGGHVVEFPNTMLCEFQCLFRWVLVPTSLWRILRKLLSESLRAAARLHAERRGDWWTEALTPPTFSRVLAVRGWPVDFCFHADPLALKLATLNKIVFRAGTGLCLPSLKCTRNPLRVAVTDSLFFINVSTMKTRCSPVQFMLATEKEIKQNGIMCTFRKYKHIFVSLLYLAFIKPTNVRSFCRTLYMCVRVCACVCVRASRTTAASDQSCALVSVTVLDLYHIEPPKLKTTQFNNLSWGNLHASHFLSPMILWSSSNTQFPDKALMTLVSRMTFSIYRGFVS